MNKIIKSKKDAEIFFKHIVDSGIPNKEIKEAMRRWFMDKDNYIITDASTEITNIKLN